MHVRHPETTAIAERHDAPNEGPRVRDQLHSAIDRELVAAAADPRRDADGALMFTDT
jgi:hypothetical protein